MLQVLHGEAIAICIEEPGVDGAEFLLRRDSGREYWQAKRQVLSQGNWSLRLLKTKGVLDFFLERLRAGDSCVFASMSDAPELRVLAEKARNAESWEVFHNVFLRAGGRENFDELRSQWNSLPDKEVFNCLRRIRVEAAGECTFESLLTCVARVTFAGPPQTALAVLQQVYLSSVHQTLSAEAIQQHLKSYGVQRRAFMLSAADRDALFGITDAYIAGQRSRLIRGRLLERQIAAEVVKRVTDTEQSLDLVLVGRAGVGKSGCLLQVVEGLRRLGLPILAFRLNGVSPVSSPQALGKELNLPESPAVVLARAFPGKPIVLAIDQLDFMSATSGRHPAFFDVIAAVVEEVRGLRASNRVHLVLACRQFDFENDHRFRRLLSPDQPPILIGPLTEREVTDVITAEHPGAARLSPRQLELLQLPQNLSLFIEAGLVAKEAPSFITQKDLFDCYWETKCRAVSAACPDGGAQWLSLIKLLTEEMSVRQELSVPKARLDGFSPALLGAMVSEGVLTFDKQRYGFGHESFFDYCFARSIASRNAKLLTFLESDDQQLFRRAQLRQVLVYLRDDDPARYLCSVPEVLRSDKVRSHLKLLVLELLASFPNPLDEELGVLLPYLEEELDCRRHQKANPNRIGSRAFDTFFASRSIFSAAKRLGYIERWLNSGEPWLEDLMALYLRWQAFQHADAVAELLEPCAGKGGQWAIRLRHIMEWGNLGKGRRFFDLFLRLLDDGTLDDAGSRFGSNGTFWGTLGDLAECQPIWLAELAAHWLDRRVAVGLAAGGAEQGVSLGMEFGVEELSSSAEAAPKEYLEQVLPAILRAAQAFACKDTGALSRDGVWWSRYRGEHVGVGEAYLVACESALRCMGKGDPDSLRPFVTELRSQPLHTANHLLLTAYLVAPTSFAEEALQLLADEPGRLLCGFEDSAHWVSRCVIEQCSPHCTEETYRRLEAAVLAYTTEYERSEEGSAYRGHAAYCLASGLPPSRRSTAMKEQYAKWQEMFSEPDGPPRGIRAYSVVSPIPRDVAEGFSDGEWLEAIAEHNADRGMPDWKNPERGGASEFAALMHEFVQKDPERFARLCLRFPQDTHPSYLMNVLYGLNGAVVAPSLKCDVARRTFESTSKACLKAALDVLGGLGDFKLPEDAMDFIRRMATTHPDPEAARCEHDISIDESHLASEGINSVRGRAAEAIGKLVRRNLGCLGAFSTTIDLLVDDTSISVRTCVVSTLSAVAAHDAPRALTLLERLVQGDSPLLATNSVHSFVGAGLRTHLAEVRPFILRMLASKYKEARRSGGVLACLARLYHRSAGDLAEIAFAGDIQCRLGATTVAKDNFTNSDCKEWCECKLKILFNDPEADVRKEAARCFWWLWHQPLLPLDNFDSLIRAFVESSAFGEEPTFLLHALEDTQQRVPSVILAICEQFVAKCAEQARDIRTSLAADEHTVGKLVFRAYAQFESEELRGRTLNLIDRMCEEGLQSAGQHLGEFER